MQPIALKAVLQSSNVSTGTEISPSVYVVNTSGKTLHLEYIKPLLVVPTIVDDITRETVPNAPSYVYDQICAFEKSPLPPNGELSLNALPILIKKQSTSADEIKHLHAFWSTLPGSFTLKYSIPAKNLLPGALGELHAELPIKIIDPDKTLSGILSFDDQTGYYLSMGTKGGKGLVWLKTHDKPPEHRLKKLLGSEVKVRGCLERQSRDPKGGIEAGSLFFSSFNIE